MAGMTEYTTGTGQKLRVHTKEDCKGDHCCIHNPSLHSLSSSRTHWRHDRGIMERICDHGVGHPDPDGIAYIRSILGGARAETEAIHGCDGCCQ